MSTKKAARASSRSNRSRSPASVKVSNVPSSRGRSSTPTRARRPSRTSSQRAGKLSQSPAGRKSVQDVINGPSAYTRSQTSQGSSTNLLPLDSVVRTKSLDKLVLRLIGEQTVNESLESEECLDFKTRPLVANALEPRRRKRDIARPYVMKGLMSGLIYMLGEAISCGLFYKDKKYGFYPQEFLHYSVLHSTLIGALANGPMLQLFFECVDYLVDFKSRLYNVVAKVFLDQVVWGCLWNFSYILLMNIATDSPGFGYIGEGLGIERGPIRLWKGIISAFWKARDPYMHVQLLREGLKMLPMDIICYWLVPLSLRSTWIAAVDVFWVTILSQYD